MTDIAEFLTARLDGDEKTATGLRDMVRSLNEINDRRPPDTRQGTQIYDAAAWALERVLADIAAKRRLLALWQRIDSGVYSPDANQVADDILEQLLAPYGKRAAWTRDAGWRIADA